MSGKSTKVGIELPGDLEAEPLDTLSGIAGMIVGAAWNGVVYRWTAAFNEHLAWAKSVADSIMPDPVGRHRQEALLFHFFADANSCLETFYLGCYGLAARIRPEDFKVETRTLRLYPADVATKMVAAWPNSEAIASLKLVAESAEYKELKDMRDALAHRGPLPRQFHKGGELEGAAFIPQQPKASPLEWEFTLPVEPRLTGQYLEWLATTLNKLADLLVPWAQDATGASSA